MARLFTETAARRPDDPALVGERGTTTWRALDGRTHRALQSRSAARRPAGLSAGDAIALLAGTRREYSEVMGAGMHAGLFVVPVNWHWVARELAYVVDNSDAVALVADDRFLGVARAGGG